jgi:hypothetical protein
LDKMGTIRTGYCAILSPDQSKFKEIQPVVDLRIGEDIYFSLCLDNT